MALLHNLGQLFRSPALQKQHQAIENIDIGSTEKEKKEIEIDYFRAIYNIYYRKLIQNISIAAYQQCP